jgi:hypothetical protein
MLQIIRSWRSTPPNAEFSMPCHKPILAALAVLALAACQKPAGPDAAAPAPAAPPADMPMKGGEVAMTHDAGPGWNEPDAKLFFQLALLEGHLRIGRELVEAGRYQQALPHFGHPVRELYGDIRPLLQRRNVPQFYRDLVRLEALAAGSPGSPEFRATFDKVMQETRAARASIPVEMQAKSAFRLRIAANVLRTAAQEYRNAVVAGKVENAVEYHDARGFVFYARDLIAADQGGAPYMQAALKVLDQVKAGVAPLDPPRTPILTPEQFDAMAAELEAIQGGRA